MTFSIINADIFVSPDTHLPLCIFGGGGGELCTADGSERFPVGDGIIYLLPREISNQKMKANEREGWKKVAEHNQWAVDGPAILALPESSHDYYWIKVTNAFRIAASILGDVTGKRGLDVACGIGWASAKFASAGARMIAADFNDTEFNVLGSAIRARDSASWFDAVCCDGESLPVADDSLDFAFICSALHHFADPVKSLSEIYRVLKPGGVIVDICESFALRKNDPQTEEEYVQLKEFREAGINEQCYTQSEYERIYKEAGFEVVTLWPEWDRPVAGQSPERWINSGLSDLALTHHRVAVRFMIKYFRFDFLTRILRWRRNHFTTGERIFFARKNA